MLRHALVSRLLAASIAALPVFSARADEPTIPTADPLASAAATMEQVVPQEHLSPMVAEIYTALDQQQALINRLNGELAATRDPGRAFELQREIVAAKQEVEVRMLRIQAEHARRDGRDETVAALEGAIEALVVQAGQGESTSRPATADAR